MRALLAGLLVLATVPAGAAERNFTVTSFDRVRVEAPFEVRLAVGGSPRGSASGDAAALDRVELVVLGTTLVVRMANNGWGERPRGSGAAAVVTLSTPALRAATLTGGGKLAVTGLMRAQRVELGVSGSGAMTVAAVEADRLDATLLGTGTLGLSGRAQRAVLAGIGSGLLDAAGLTVGDLAVQLDGTGEVRAAARFTAAVTNAGLGRVTVQGPATCTIKGAGVFQVLCGKDAPAADAPRSDQR